MFMQKIACNNKKVFARCITAAYLKNLFNLLAATKVGIFLQMEKNYEKKLLNTCKSQILFVSLRLALYHEIEGMLIERWKLMR